MVSVEISSPEEVGHILDCLDGKKTNPDGNHDIRILIGNGQCWKITEGGNISGAFVTELKGRTLWSTAAAGKSRHDLTAILDDFLTTYAKGRADKIMFRTARRGFVEKAKKRGYEVAEYWMKKKI